MASLSEVQAYKPDPRPYRHVATVLGVANSELTMIASHGWDVLGAQAAGLGGIWVDRTEREWPFPGSEPRRRAPGLVEAAALLG